MDLENTGKEDHYASIVPGGVASEQETETLETPTITPLSSLSVLLSPRVSTTTRVSASSKETKIVTQRPPSVITTHSEGTSSASRSPDGDMSMDAERGSLEPNPLSCRMSSQETGASTISMNRIRAPRSTMLSMSQTSPASRIRKQSFKTRTKPSDKCSEELVIRNWAESSGKDISSHAYREYAAEYHVSGDIKSAEDADSKSINFKFRFTRVYVFLVLISIVISALVPTLVLTITSVDNTAVIASGLVNQVTSNIFVSLHGLFFPARVACQVISQASQRGLIDANATMQVDDKFSRDAKLIYGLLFDQIHLNTTGYEAVIEWIYVGNEFDVFLGFSIASPGNMILWNRTHPAILAPGPEFPAPLADTTGHVARSGWQSIEGAKFNETEMIATRSVYYTRQRGWYTGCTPDNSGDQVANWIGPYIFSDGVTLGMTACLSMHNEDGVFVGVVGTDITLNGLVASLNDERFKLSSEMRNTIIQANGYFISTTIPGVQQQEEIDGKSVRLKASDPRQPQELLDIVNYLTITFGALDKVSTIDEVREWNEHYISVLLLEDEFGLDWIYVMTAPKADYLETLWKSQRMSTAVIICTGLAVLFIAITSSVHLTSQLLHFRRDMRFATSLELNQINYTDSIVGAYEVASLRAEFAKLVNALTSFKKYLPPHIVHFLLRSNQIAQLGVIREKLTILFLDMECFTDTLEKMSDSETEHFYDYLMTTLTDQIQSTNGTLDKYIGDCIMAFWNMPRVVHQHPDKAVLAAIKCRGCLPFIKAKGWDMEFRIGINTGMCMVGNLGSRVRLNYTAIGDAVNVAARLEGLNKMYHTRILVSGSTHAELSPNTYLTRMVDRVTVKGRKETTDLYEVRDLAHRAPVSDHSTYREYGDALQSYMAGDFPKAAELWRKLSNCTTSQLMAKRVVDHLMDESKSPFTGVWNWERK